MVYYRASNVGFCTFGGMWRMLLIPFSWVYGFVLLLRHWLYDVGIFKSVKFELPVIVVGNLSTGGTGKTPQTIYLAKLLASYHPALLSRGYGRSSKGFKWVENNSTVTETGDEPLLFKQTLGAIPIAVCEDRVAGIRKIIAEKKPGVILLDDAYQHRKLVPGFSVLLIDFASLQEPSYLLPAGNQRDLWSRRKKANVVVITKCPETINNIDKNRLVEHINKGCKKSIPVYFSHLKYGEVRRFSGEIVHAKELKNQSVILVTGIARPALLKADLELKTQLIDHHSFSDHYAFTQGDLESMKKNMAMFASIRPLFITTSKDRVRLEPLLSPLEKHDWLEIPVEIEIDESQQFHTIIENYVRSNS
jgi:tetraacyldisaccharide 4'-kinase